MQSASVLLFAFLLCLSCFNCDSRNTITADNVLSKGETLVSAGEIFELGFFTTKSDDGESNDYVGIWYKVSPKTVVWVANKNKSIPISTELLVIAIDDDGNLKVLDSMRNSYFSTEVTSSSSNLKHTTKLLDSGNLVLIDDLSGKRLWQSFDNPTDTFLPDDKKQIDVPFFNLKNTLAATDSFSDANKLGRGGFGPVYKAWKLWMENKALDMMDPILVDTCTENEALKCINVALLCVQENSGDRPTMSNVIIMLGSESMVLPRPNHPAFVTRRNMASMSSSSSYKTYTADSNNELTITVGEGR
ncbi:hypothetical protein K7X08_021516 [Anisodus acutangulus]|uniref:Bulb-type lectin domain-containing protein n=1 Tax=Anisodus acutangulus TaxID=402998 RepID=A0A9Q1RDX3_9SOLA|nr:hypothetical protein K7X08_021516 [Anisodus acutangulus]